MQDQPTFSAYAEYDQRTDCFWELISLCRLMAKR